MTFEIFLDILIIALLSVGIVYAIILEYRLSSAKENKRELAHLMEQFYKASQKTAEEFIHLQKMEDDARSALKNDMEKAALIRDELVFLINKIQETHLPKQTKTALPSQHPTNTLRSQAEQDLINALNTLK
ncbi:MAG: hypothetical protein IKV03_05045 [Alphaproteobacteria bacterium]|nr:hypothetical protein [Alphaproteobacteria bacterium]